VTIAPDNVIARLNLAAALVRLGRREGAMEQYRAALQSDPQSSAAHYGRGWASVSYGDFETARRELVVLKTLDLRLADTLAADIAAARRSGAP
jgi:Flp pilus assembly protein TadD